MREAALTPGDWRSQVLPSEADTLRFGERLGALLKAGDWVSLIGPLGVGKTALARSLIQSRLGVTTEVPSPSYTLVNVYDSTPQIWHADLYRLSEAEEADELGLLDDLANKLVLVEWPERLGTDMPPRRLEIELAFEGDQGRTITLSPHGGWELEGLM